MEGAGDGPALGGDPAGGGLADGAESPLWGETASVGSALASPPETAPHGARRARGSPSRFEWLPARGAGVPRGAASAAPTPPLPRKRSTGGSGALPFLAGSFASPAGTPRAVKRHSAPAVSPNGGTAAQPRPQGPPAAACDTAAAAGAEARRHAAGGPAAAEPTGSPRRPKGDVAVCVRLLPGPRSDACISVESANCVRLRCRGDARDTGSVGPIYWCDQAFGQEATQEEVYGVAVAPVCASVLRGYNGAVLAYGQTGSGKTHTIIGDAQRRGAIPRAVSAIFEALRARQHWSVDVCMLEIYNERTRDLLAPGQDVCQVDVHEVQDPAGASSFRCPGATRRAARSAEEALASLGEGLGRRETARTDMNHNSSRSHLIFTLDVTQVDEALGATLRGRLHLVDLAGSERLKRSMASQASNGGDRSLLAPSKSPRELNTQRREACAINKSLAQLALVIQRLSAGGSLRHVPYRDSMLTRLLADSFGGSSKTCLIITCSSLDRDLEETRGTLEFGKRAGLVRNVAQINLEVAQEPSEVAKALLAKELAEMTLEKEALQLKVREAAVQVLRQERLRALDVRRLEEENSALEAELRRAREEQGEMRRLLRESAALPAVPLPAACPRAAPPARRRAVRCLPALLAAAALAGAALAAACRALPAAAPAPEATSGAAEESEQRLRSGAGRARAESQRAPVARAEALRGASLTVQGAAGRSGAHGADVAQGTLSSGGGEAS